MLTDAQVYCMTSIYFDHHLPLKPSIGKRRKQSCTLNNLGNDCFTHTQQDLYEKKRRENRKVEEKKKNNNMNNKNNKNKT